MNEETTLDVTGMTCQSCVRHVDKALRKIDGVSEVEVHLEQGKVRVKHDPARATVPSMIAALKKAGYESSAPD
jgi:copper ion binding protein